MHKSISYHDSPISYSVHGTGKTVVLLHGFGEDSRIWDDQVAFLQEHCQLIVPDIPGSGNSALLQLHKLPSARQRDNVSIDDYADVVHAILQAEKIDHCLLLGHSMGGYITLAFAEKYPERLTGFGLIHSTAFADSEEKKQLRTKAIETIGRYGAAPFLKNTIPNLFGKSFKEKYPERINQLIHAAAGFTTEALQQYYQAMIHRPDRCQVLKSNRLPVLFVIGTEDMAAPMEDVLKQVSLPDISYIHILPDCGHMGMWEAPDTLNQLLLAFIHP
ncbi:MAG: alpha/beta hydrolase [Bacteroidetes bacterium]|nr:alpha/beta hydrolase [Bacteroidota bacterium]